MTGPALHEEHPARGIIDHHSDPHSHVGEENEPTVRTGRTGRVCQDPGLERRAAARAEPPVVADGLQSSTSRAGRESTNVEGMWGVSRVLTAPPPALVLPRRADGGGATVPALWKGGPGIQ